MNYAGTDRIIAKRRVAILNIHSGETPPGSCTLSRESIPGSLIETHNESLEPVKGVVVAILFSLPFWLSVGYLFAR